MGKFLAVDWGTKRLGLAMGSKEARLATPLKTLLNSPKIWDELKEIIDSEDVEKIILGLPRSLDGTEGPQSRQVRVFGEMLKDQLNIPVVFQDETLTSHEAANQRASDINAAAAGIILQDYLDSL